MNYTLIENIAGVIFPFINMIFMIIIVYQFILLYKKPRGKMYYRPWHGLMWAFFFFSVIIVLTFLKKISIIVYPFYINGVLEFGLINSLLFTVFAIKMRKKYDPHHHLNISLKKVNV
jgi:hypothetical protein